MYQLFLQAVKDEVILDDSFSQKFGKLRQITEGVTVVLLDRYACASTMQAKHASRLKSCHHAGAEDSIALHMYIGSATHRVVLLT